MVIAVAALFLNLAAGTNAAPDLSAKPDNTAPKTAVAAASSSKENTTKITSSDSGNAAKFNLENVKLGDKASASPGAEAAPKPSETPAPKLTATSLDITHTPAALSTIRIPEPGPIQPVEVKAAEKHPYTKQWLVITAVQHGAAAFDAYSTRQAISRGAVEDDPMMRPFAHSDGIYAAIQAGPVALDFVARHMQHSENGFIRRMWWMPQAISTGGFLFSGVHNLGVVRQEKK